MFTIISTVQVLVKKAFVTLYGFMIMATKPVVGDSNYISLISQ